MNISLNVLKASIDAKTPEDSKTLIWNNKIEHAKIVGDTVVWKVVNDTEYAELVELGVWLPFNYHKPKGKVFYRGSGARMFTRGLDSSRNEILNIIKK
jgi:hypothetical protein